MKKPLRARLTLRGRLLWLAAEWELYADRQQVKAARRAYRDAAEGLRRTLAKALVRS